MAVRCVLLVCALALLQVQGEHNSRCAYDASGDLVGYEVDLSLDYLTPVNNKVYHQKINPISGCYLNGMSAKACDLFPPEVEITANNTLVTVRRLGPRLFPPSLEVTLYCDPYTLNGTLE